MAVTSDATRRYGRGVLLTALAVYSIAFTVGVFDHHSLSCHLNSRTHCTSCTFSLSSFGIEVSAGPAVSGLPENGWLLLQALDCTPAPVASRASGRSPPA